MVEVELAAIRRHSAIVAIGVTAFVGGNCRGIRWRLLEVAPHAVNTGLNSVARAVRSLDCGAAARRCCAGLLRFRRAYEVQAARLSQTALPASRAASSVMASAGPQRQLEARTALTGHECAESGVRAFLESAFGGFALIPRDAGGDRAFLAAT